MLAVKTIPLTLFEQCSRVLIDTQTAKAMVIDPGGEVEKILTVIDSSQADVELVVLTHAHLDHAGAVAPLLRELKTRGAAVCFAAHPGEAEMRGSIAQQASMFGLAAKEFENAPEPDLQIDHGDVLKFGSLEAEVIFTPGHSPGHISLFFKETDLSLETYDSALKVTQQLGISSPALFSGDCLFAGSIGRTDLPGGDHQTLLTSIRERLLTLPGETRVFCGHGPDTSIAREKSTNPFLTGLSS